MKRIFTLIALIGIMMTAYAQRPLVTLSHNGELSFFSTTTALEMALDSAVNGDIIYLSEGDFTSNSSQITINKRVSIVGCGYKSHILADLTIEMYHNPDSYMDAPLFDGVRLKKLYFAVSNESRNNLKKVLISNSWINKLEKAGYAGNDFNIDRCYIESADFGGASENNVYISNSKIDDMVSQYSSPYCVQVVNCNIGYAYYCPRIVISSIIGRGTRWDNDTYKLVANGTHIIKNSLFSDKMIIDDDNIKTYDCYFDAQEGGVLNENLEATMNLQEKGYLGEDGTVVGIYGGQFPFSEIPSVPTVDASKSSLNYDAENNKLNVTITVSPSN